MRKYAVSETATVTRAAKRLYFVLCVAGLRRRVDGIIKLTHISQLCSNGAFVARHPVSQRPCWRRGTLLTAYYSLTHSLRKIIFVPETTSRCGEGGKMRNATAAQSATISLCHEASHSLQDIMMR